MLILCSAAVLMLVVWSIEESVKFASKQICTLQCKSTHFAIEFRWFVDGNMLWSYIIFLSLLFPKMCISTWLSWSETKSFPITVCTYSVARMQQSSCYDKGSAHLAAHINGADNNNNNSIPLIIQTSMSISYTHLPLEVWGVIFSYCTPEKRRVLRTLCKGINIWFSAHPTHSTWYPKQIFDKP